MDTEVQVDNRHKMREIYHISGITSDGTLVYYLTIPNTWVHDYAGIVTGQGLYIHEDSGDIVITSKYPEKDKYEYIDLKKISKNGKRGYRIRIPKDWVESLWEKNTLTKRVNIIIIPSDINPAIRVRKVI